jgi:hypothetical protein
MIAGALGGLSVALDLISFVPFIWAGLFGRARPGRISWSMWSAEYWVLFLAELTRAQATTVRQCADQR